MNKNVNNSASTHTAVNWKDHPNSQSRTPEKKTATENLVRLKTQKKWKHLPIKSPTNATSLPSPIDRVRIGINRRAEVFGLNCWPDKSFERNQSFPRVSKQSLRRYEIDLDTPPTKLIGMDKIRVDGSNGLRFSLRRVKGCFTPGSGSPFSASLAASSAADTLSRVAKSGINPNKAVFTIDSKTSQILIVNHNASQLLGYTPRELCSMQFSELLANKNKSHVCALAEGQLNTEDGTMVLLSGKVVEMLNKSGNKVAVSLWIRQIDCDGRCLAVAEPVERRVCQIAIDKNGLIASADYETLMIFQFETIDQLIGLDIGMLIPALIIPEPESSVIAKHVRKQKATGKTAEGVSFPLCLLITKNEAGIDNTECGLSSSSSSFHLITVWVFQNLSGLIVIDDVGTIESCNHHFSMLMFGFAQNKVLGQNISKIIPNFGQELEYLEYSRSRNITESSLDNEESETETDPIYMSGRFFGGNAKNKTEAVEISLDYTKAPADGKEEQLLFVDGEKKCPVLLKSVSADILAADNAENNRNMANLVRQSNHPTEFRHSIAITDANVLEGQYCLNDNDLLTPVNDAYYPPSQNKSSSLSQTYKTADISAGFHSHDSLSNISKDLSGVQSFESKSVSSSAKDDSSVFPPVTSTPDIRKHHMQPTTSSAKGLNYADGKYRGEAFHCDGNVIDILYTISCQILPCGRKVHCVWICRDPDVVYELEEDVRHQNLTLTFNSVTSTVENSLGQAIRNTAAQNSSRPNSVSLMSQCEDEQIGGEFSKHYTTLKQIGKGAYGYVKMAYRNSDRLLVVAKFILKEKLCPQFMIVTDDKKEIPMEIYLLTTVKHVNIVTVYDVFENEKFFQLVMEKHGSGMDLFEFIDRRPMIDEKLGCFIFRQIANSVNYLHSLNILHRDIKDENIIIDQNFHVKLIDFGSATFMEEGKLFSTFFGTTEYCSPEVLAGNKYAGPELEMWSLGVTLYVLMFFENPFLDVEETLRGDLVMPHKVSANLENLLLGMLDKDPKTRYTMRQLMADPWINQEINPAIFNFSWIVPCEAHEANPDKYYTGQVYASVTGLSTTSPQDSLSLVDEDSMIDGDEAEELEEEEEMEEDKASIRSQDPIFNRISDKGSIVQGYSASKTAEKLNNLRLDESITANSSALRTETSSTGNLCESQQPGEIEKNDTSLSGDKDDSEKQSSNASYEIVSIVEYTNKKYDDENWEDFEDDKGNVGDDQFYEQDSIS